MDLLSPLGGKDYSITERRGLQPRAFQSVERNNNDWWRYTVRLYSSRDVFILVVFFFFFYSCRASVYRGSMIELVRLFVCLRFHSILCRRRSSFFGFYFLLSRFSFAVSFYLVTVDPRANR